MDTILRILFTQLGPSLVNFGRGSGKTGELFVPYGPQLYSNAKGQVLKDRLGKDPLLENLCNYLTKVNGDRYAEELCVRMFEEPEESTRRQFSYETENQLICQEEKSELLTRLESMKGMETSQDGFIAFDTTYHVDILQHPCILGGIWNKFWNRNILFPTFDKEPPVHLIDKEALSKPPFPTISMETPPVQTLLSKTYEHGWRAESLECANKWITLLVDISDGRAECKANSYVECHLESLFSENTKSLIQFQTSIQHVNKCYLSQGGSSLAEIGDVICAHIEIGLS